MRNDWIIVFAVLPRRLGQQHSIFPYGPTAATGTAADILSLCKGYPVYMAPRCIMFASTSRSQHQRTLFTPFSLLDSELKPTSHIVKPPTTTLGNSLIFVRHRMIRVGGSAA
jgi:hypothetical protein